MLFYFAKVLTETGPGLSITYVYIKIIYISFNFFIDYRNQVVKKWFLSYPKKLSNNFCVCQPPYKLNFIFYLYFLLYFQKLKSYR